MKLMWCSSDHIYWLTLTTDRDIHRGSSSFILMYLLSHRDELMWISTECSGGKSSDTYTHACSARTWTHPHLCSFVRGFNDVPLHSSPNSVPLWLAWWPLPCASMFSHTTWMSIQVCKFVLVRGKHIKTECRQRIHLHSLIIAAHTHRR